MTEIDRYTYFLLGMKAGAYKWKAWILRCFSKSNVKELEVGLAKFNSRFSNGKFLSDEKNYPYELYKDEDRLCFIHPEKGEVVYITNGAINQPLLNPNETIFVPDNVIANIKEKITTTVGRLLFNQLCVVYAFGDKIPFVNQETNYGKIEKYIARLLKDEPKEGESRDESAIYPSEMDKYYVGTGMATGLNGICVPSATPYTLSPAPKALKLFKELCEKHKDELNDPIVTSKIWAQVKPLDMEYVKSDPEYGFLIKEKHFDVVRKKMFYCYGEEWSLDGKEMTFITKPLTQGLDTENLPAVYNGTREGSFSRGALTALAGERTKNVVRSTSGTMVSLEDCGTKLGLRTVIQPEAADKHIGHFIVSQGKSIELTAENIGNYVGKRVTLRSTAYCNGPENDFCIRCVGKEIEGRENSLSAEASAVTSGFMGTFMSLMHGTVYRTTRFNMATALGV